MSVDRGVGNEHALGLGLIGTPEQVEAHCFIHLVAFEHGTVEGGDGVHREGGYLAQRSRHLLTVLAADIEIVAACFVRPVVGVGSIDAELTEGVSGEERQLLGDVGHHHLWPVDHGGSEEMERHAADVHRLAVLNHYLVRHLDPELLQHLVRGAGSHHLRVWVALQECTHRTAMVGLHVLHDEVGRLRTVECGFQLRHPLVGLASVHRIHHGDAVRHEDITIVAHALRHMVLTLKQVQIGIVHTDVFYFLGKHRLIMNYEL